MCAGTLSGEGEHTFLQIKFHLRSETLNARFMWGLRQSHHYLCHCQRTLLKRQRRRWGEVRWQSPSETSLACSISGWKALEGGNQQRRERGGWVAKEGQGKDETCRPATTNQNVSGAQECHRWGLAGDNAVVPWGERLRTRHHRAFRAEREWALWHRPGLRLLCLLHLLLLFLGEQTGHSWLKMRPALPYPTPPHPPHPPHSTLQPTLKGQDA